MNQSYIPTTKLHQYNSKITPTRKTGPTGRNPELEDEKLTKNLYASRAFQPVFGALSEVKIKLIIAFWKALDVCYPTQLEFPNLELIRPSKTSFSHKYFLLVQKVAER